MVYSFLFLGVAVYRTHGQWLPQPRADTRTGTNLGQNAHRTLHAASGQAGLVSFAVCHSYCYGCGIIPFSATAAQPFRCCVAFVTLTYYWLTVTQACFGWRMIRAVYVVRLFTLASAASCRSWTDVAMAVCYVGCQFDSARYPFIRSAV